MRRDKNDEKWQAAKKRCFELDKKRCLLCQCMTVKESLIYKQNLSGFSIITIDPAHHYPVSLRPDLMYNADENIFCLCRAHHEALDHMRDPITGDFCSPDVTENYWQRIIQQRKENLSQTHSLDSDIDKPFFESLDDDEQIITTDTNNFGELFYEDL